MSLSTLVAAALSLALVLALHVRVSRIPHVVWSLARRERAQDGASLLDSMKEAVAARSGHAIVAIQAYQEQIAQSLRIQIAEAETRSRAAERRAAEAVKALDAASDLVRDLRAVVEAASGVTRRLSTLDHGSRPSLATTVPAPRDAHPTFDLEDWWEPRGARPPGVTDEDAERKTTEMSSAPSYDGPASIDVEFDFDDENEKTRIAAPCVLPRAPIVVPPPRPPASPLYAGAAGEPTSLSLRRPRRTSTLLPPPPGTAERR
jgi:hypothetical protein